MLNLLSPQTMSRSKGNFGRVGVDVAGPVFHTHDLFASTFRWGQPHLTPKTRSPNGLAMRFSHKKTWNHGAGCATGLHIG